MIHLAVCDMKRMLSRLIMENFHHLLMLMRRSKCVGSGSSHRVSDECFHLTESQSSLLRFHDGVVRSGINADIKTVVRLSNCASFRAVLTTLLIDRLKTRLRIVCGDDEFSTDIFPGAELVVSRPMGRVLVEIEI